MNIEKILIDKSNQMAVGKITKKYGLTREVAYAIMWCLDRVPCSQILPRLLELKDGMLGKEIERVMKMGNELNLIRIHKRNVGILEKQKAHLGLHCPMHVQSQLDFEIGAIKDLEVILNRRLQGLLEKAALYGISADPSIGIEIEDIEKYFKD